METETAFIDDFEKGLTEITDKMTSTDKTVASLTTTVDKLRQENERLEAEFSKVRRLHLARTSAGYTAPSPGMVSDECASYLGATFILQCAKSGKLELLSQSSATRDALHGTARHTPGI